MQVSNNVDLTLTENFFYSAVNGENIEGGFSNENLSWTISLLIAILVPNWFSVPLQGNYHELIVLLQGQIEPQSSLNIGLRRNILDNKAAVSFNVSDIFNIRNFRITTDDRRFT